MFYLFKRIWWYCCLGGKWLDVCSWNCIFLKVIQHPFENMIYDWNFHFSLFNFPVIVWIFFLPSLFSEFHPICSSVLFWKNNWIQGKLLSEVLEAVYLGSTDRWVIINISEILLESVFSEHLENVSFSSAFLLDYIVAWVWFQAIGLLNGMENRSLEKRGVRNLGPEKL